MKSRTGTALLLIVLPAHASTIGTFRNPVAESMFYLAGAVAVAMVVGLVAVPVYCSVRGDSSFRSIVKRTVFFELIGFCAFVSLFFLAAFLN